MKSTERVFLAIACLALAALSCQAVTRSGGGGEDTSVIPATDVPEQGHVILADDFSSAQWGTGTDSDSSVEYSNEALQMIVFTKNYFVWSTPDDQDYENIHMEVTVTNHENDPTTAFGIMCHQQATSDAFYYFAITPAGQYAITKAVAPVDNVAQDDVILTNDGKWKYSDSVKENAPSYRVGADCGNGTLTLYVDDQKVASVSDSSYTDGGVALFTWSGEDVASANVSFDDFLMRNLP